MPKSAMAEGLAYLMRDPRTNPTTPAGRKVFNEMLSASGMPMTETLKYVGKKSRQPRVNEDDRSQTRLEKLEQEQPKK
tara:strand:- start:1454 stop:1687 length:234 start_codon:yes stop_codon:yes gene_type:complete